MTAIPLRGRPRTKPNGPRMVAMTPADYDLARALGNGSAASGVRQLVAQMRTRMLADVQREDRAE